MGAIEGEAPAKLSKAQAAWLDQSGLSKLRGPGGWVSYETRPATAPPGEPAVPAPKPFLSKPVATRPPAAQQDKPAQGRP